MADKATINKVLKDHGRAILHMRQQKSIDRFGLIVGAGASMALGFPSWKELIERIASDPEVNGTDLLAAGKHGNTSVSQLLFQRYRQSVITSAGEKAHELNKTEAESRAGWQAIVHRALYKSVPAEADELLKRDLYMKHFLELIKKSPLTINYNFDDSLQRMLLHTRSAAERRKTRGFFTVWHTNIQMFPPCGTIYHPNGFLPFNLRERPSEHLVFLEDSFADQLIDSMVGHYNALSYHLAQATRLLVGLSLDDATLRHLLRHSAKLHPGHYHYYISHVRDGATLDGNVTDCTVTANFETYNLITLFLTSSEIEALATLLDVTDDEFRAAAEEAGIPTSLRFLITGAVAVGKTTVVSQFRCLKTLDEWLDERPPGMEKDPGLATADELAKIDAFVAEQVALKNLRLINSKDGIYIADRGPLDLFAFEKDRKQWKAKAQSLLGALSPGHADRELAACHVIFLTGDPDIMAVRATTNHRHTDSVRLATQQGRLREVYVHSDKKTTCIDTRNKSIVEVTKEVARTVYLSGYVETPLHSWLEAYANEP